MNLFALCFITFLCIYVGFFTSLLLWGLFSSKAHAINEEIIRKANADRHYRFASKKEVAKQISEDLDRYGFA